MFKSKSAWLLALLCGCQSAVVAGSEDAAVDSSGAIDTAISGDSQDDVPGVADALDVAADPTGATLVKSVSVSMLYSQGIARLSGGWAFSAKAGLWRTDENFVQVAANDSPLPQSLLDEGYGHIGDLDLYEGKLWAALEQGDDGRLQQAMAWFDPDTLAFGGSVYVAQHENPCMCIDADTGIAYTPDRYRGNSVNRWDVKAGWKALDPIQFSQKLDAMQGVDAADGALWFSCDDAVHGLWRVDQLTGAVTQAGTIGRLESTGTASVLPEVEGVDATHLNGAFLWTLTNEPLQATSWVDAWSTPQ